MSGLRLAIMGSTRGTDMLPIIAAIAQRQLAASIECVISNKSAALILERARAHNIPALFIDPTDLSKPDYDQLLTDELRGRRIDLIILIGYMRILSADFTAAWPNKIINVHPSLLPEFAGGMNNDVHAAVLKAGKTETGCTVHYVTEQIDQGPILIQKRCSVLPTDTVESLKTRVQELEGQALIEAINLFQCRTVENSL
ncbi:MAG: phosphoribosylglycinamide formyltransferase [Pseudomonadota bacterium]